MDRSVSLSERQREILVLVAKCRSNGEIAALTGISITTIETYLERINNRLGTHSRLSAVVEALRQGVLTFKEIEEE